MIKLLGTIDIIASIFLFLTALGIDVPGILIIALAIYLIIKAILLFSLLMSLLDSASGIIFLLSIYIHVPGFIMVIIAILLLQKGISSIIK